MNIERHNAIIAKIKADPNCWDQRTWHCEATHCYAGHAQIMSGKAPDDGTARHDARVWLDLTRGEADYLFDPCRVLEELEKGLTCYDRAGLDRDGFNRKGLDADGFDRNGFDRDGFNHRGFDAEGYDCDGYDRDGFNRVVATDGYDIDGLDKNNKPRLEVVP